VPRTGATLAGMGSWATVAAWLIGLIAAGWAIDRVLVACELRGWILYRLTPRPRHEMRRAAGSALIGVDGLFRPAARHIATVTREAAVLRDDGAEGDGSGDPSRRIVARTE
jgi:hypothetical protein